MPKKRTGCIGAARRASRGLSGNVRQLNHVLANEIAGHKAERRPGAGEEWLTTTKHDGAEVELDMILARSDALPLGGSFRQEHGNGLVVCQGGPQQRADYRR